MFHNILNVYLKVQRVILNLSTLMMYKTVIYFCIICICLNECTLSPKSPKTKQSKEVKPIKNVKIKTGPLNLTVFQRNLVVENPTPKEIVSNHGAFFQETDEYNFDGMVLGYVTPVSTLNSHCIQKLTLEFSSGTIMDMM